MKYLLFVSFYFKKYKGSTKVSLYSDDKFIDEITFDQDTSVTAGRMNAIKQFRNTYKNILGQHNFRALPKCTQVYEIDDEMLGQEITVRLNDKNTNYTNGFMTKSDLVQLYHCILIPTKLLSKDKWARCVKLFERHNKYISNYKREPQYKNYDSYVKHMYWPGTSHQIVNGELVHFQWVGGNSTIVLPLVKKFNMHIVWAGKGLVDRPRFRYHWRSLFLLHNLQAINTYNEDK